MILTANSVYPGQQSGLSGWFDSMQGAITDAIGKFSTAGATRIIAQPGTTVTTRDAQGNATTIQRAGGQFNPSFGIGVGAPAAGGDDNSGTFLLLGVLAVIVIMTLNRR